MLESKVDRFNLPALQGVIGVCDDGKLQKPRSEESKHVIMGRF